MHHQQPRLLRPLLCLGIMLAALAFAAPARAQLGSLLSPGPLSKPHASLEGAANCEKCHEPGRKVTPAKCLACHQPIAERVRLRKGIHRDAGASCVTCHVEHAGLAANIRPFDTRGFDHKAETGFALDGRHAPLAVDCARCHKTRSFVTERPACASCHTNPHKPSLGTACETCHATSRAFKDASTSFNHAATAFPLAGAHATVACARCHVNKVYKGLKSASCADCHKSPHKPFGDTCASCHAPDTWKTRKVDHARTAFPLKGRHVGLDCAKCHTKPPTQAPVRHARCADCHTDPHKGTFKQDCGSCHTESGFGQAPFDHSTTRFPLAGGHTGLACERCHVQATRPPTSGGASPRVTDFRGLTTTCASCHRDPHRGELGVRCEQCHTAVTFKVTQFTHPRSPEFFAGQHQALTCPACHVADGPKQPRRTGVPVDGWKFRNLPTTCTTCHADVHLGQLGPACQTCHSLTAAKFQIAGFDHGRTGFALTGAHPGVPCAKCHARETGAFPAGPGTAVRFKGLATQCAACHKDPHLGQLPTTCETCHTTTTFKVSGFTHRNQATLFTGRHAALGCADCHKPEQRVYPGGTGTAVRYTPGGSACSTCHTDPHKGTLGATCEQCHTPTAWKTISRGFHKSTALPLEGRHLMTDCAACHQGGVMKGTPTRCYDCHWVRRQDDRYRTALGNQCEQCHRPGSWLAVNWNHGASTGVVLSPVHRALGCESCHKNGQFKGNAPTCSSCHQADYQRATSPAHAAAGFPLTCDLCHKASHATWSQAQFTHATFPLVGLHATQRCSTCHVNNVYKGTARDCFTCHRADYQNTKNPSHAAAGFPTTCESCHQASSATWNSAFNHSSTFPLVGLHASQSCNTCHVNNVFKGTPRDCFTCHRTAYQNTKSPNHAAAGFPTTCDSCHQASSATWSSTFNHNSTFPLVGLHASQSCNTCHVNNVFKGTPRDCFTCHRTAYQNTKSPNHAAAGFPTTCDSCHQASSATWNSAFNHSSTFPLVGLHASQSCNTCHVNNVFKGTPRDCFTCHRTAYQNTKSPNHVAAGFPTTCDSCHQASASTWSSSFNHSSTFPLVGRHASQACTACHVNNVYKGTPRDCFTCHRTAYQNTKSPNHAAAGFPTTCDTCHRATDATWSQGTFNHTWFPIASGRHSGNACVACHTNTSNYKVFTCTSCHARGSTDPEHRNVRGYVYDSNACYSCHPQGRS